MWHDVTSCTLDRIKGEKLIAAHCYELDMGFNRPKILFHDVFDVWSLSKRLVVNQGSKFYLLSHIYIWSHVDGKNIKTWRFKCKKDLMEIYEYMENITKWPAEIDCQ